jgi:hypothetical protein
MKQTEKAIAMQAVRALHKKECPVRYQNVKIQYCGCSVAITYRLLRDAKRTVAP